MCKRTSVLVQVSVDLMPWYCLKDAQFSALDIQAEKIHCGKVQGGEQCEEWQAGDVDDSSHRSILEIAPTLCSRTLLVLVQHPTDSRTLHNLKLHLHWRLLGGETHIGRVNPEISLFNS